MVTFYIFLRPTIFISNRSLAYQALNLDDVIFGNFQHVLVVGRVLNSNQHNINQISFDFILSSIFSPNITTLHRKKIVSNSCKVLRGKNKGIFGMIFFYLELL